MQKSHTYYNFVFAWTLFATNSWWHWCVLFYFCLVWPGCHVGQKSGSHVGISTNWKCLATPYLVKCFVLWAIVETQILPYCLQGPRKWYNCKLHLFQPLKLITVSYPSCCVSKIQNLVIGAKIGYLTFYHTSRKTRKVIPNPSVVLFQMERHSRTSFPHIFLWGRIIWQLKIEDKASA